MFTAYVVVTLLAIAANSFLGVAALVHFFVCAIHTHLLARDYSPTFGLAIGFLLLAVAALVLGLAT
jgi:hypothetical protein